MHAASHWTGRVQTWVAGAPAGASQVLLLDREPLALQCALLNASLNGVPITGATAGAAAIPKDTTNGSSGGSSVHASGSSHGGTGGAGTGLAGIPSLEELLPYLAPEQAARLGHCHGCGEQSAGAEASLWVGSVAAAEFDWNRPAPLEPPDVLLVADCLYSPSAVQVMCPLSAPADGFRSGRAMWQTACSLCRRGAGICLRYRVSCKWGQTCLPARRAASCAHATDAAAAARSSLQAVAGVAPQLLPQAGGQLIVADPLHRAHSNRCQACMPPARGLLYRTPAVLLGCAPGCTHNTCVVATLESPCHEGRVTWVLRPVASCMKQICFTSRGEGSGPSETVVEAPLLQGTLPAHALQGKRLCCAGGRAALGSAHRRRRPS